MTSEPLYTSERTNLASFLFFVVRSGSGTLTYNGKTSTLQQGDCVFLDCHKGYAHRTSTNLWSLSWIHFYGPTMLGIYEKYISRGGKECFHPQDISSYLSLLQELYELASSEDYVKDMVISEKITILLTQLMKESWHPELNSTSSQPNVTLQEIKDYLEQNYTKKISLDFLAETFYINKFHLTRIFKKQFGVSIHNYLVGIRITHAKQLLRFTHENIDAISLACGMYDANYFSRIFKKKEGVTPNEYRNSWH